MIAGMCRISGVVVFASQLKMLHLSPPNMVADLLRLRRSAGHGASVRGLDGAPRRKAASHKRASGRRAGDPNPKSPVTA